MDDQRSADRIFCGHSARLRFAVVGPLLASPPARGELRAEIERRAQRTWQHPYAESHRDVHPYSDTVSDPNCDPDAVRALRQCAWNLHANTDATSPFGNPNPDSNPARDTAANGNALGHKHTAARTHPERHTAVDLDSDGHASTDQHARFVADAHRNLHAPSVTHTDGNDDPAAHLDPDGALICPTLGTCSC